jgi:hypothetical protein
MLTNTGLLTVLPTNAILLVDDYTCETQPFMVFDYGNQRMGTVTNKSIGKNPQWHDELQFLIHGELDTIKIAMCDRLAAHGEKDLNLFIETEINLVKICGGTGKRARETYSDWYDLHRDGQNVGVVHLSFKFQQHALSAEEFAMKDMEMVHQYDYLFTQMHWHKDWIEKVQNYTGGESHLDVDKMVQNLGPTFNDPNKDQHTVVAFRELAKKACPCDRWGKSVKFSYSFSWADWYDTTYTITLNPDGTWENFDQFVSSRDSHSDCMSFGVYWVVGDRVDFEGFRKEASADWDYRESFHATVLLTSFYMRINSEGKLVIPDSGQRVNMNPDGGFPCTLS